MSRECALRPLRARGAEIGTGEPSIIVPVMGATAEDVCAQARALAGHRVDVVEWRADHLYPELADVAAHRDAVAQTGPALRSALDGDPRTADLPVLATLRSRAEGGQRDLNPEEYAATITALLDSGAADLVDIETLREGVDAAELLARAHGAGVGSVASHHDFRGTPSVDEMVACLRRMQKQGADAAKIAVTPQDAGDVLDLMRAAWIMSSEYARIPIIAVSMGPLGAVTRIAGGLVGSAATFAALEAASAPGQIGVDDLVAIRERAPLMGQ